MSNYHLTNEAVQDLSEIWLYTVDTWSEEQADKYYDMLIRSCSEVAQRPSRGKNYDKVTKDLLGIKSNRLIIFYRIITPTKVEITRILHDSMDLKNRIKNRKPT